MKNTGFTILILLTISSINVLGQDFVYTPVNPAFGGNAYNYTWLLGSAQAQNTYTEEGSDYSLYEEDPLSDFQDNVDRQLLNEISRELYSTQFGDAGLTEGSYEFGSYQVEVSQTQEGMSIRIMDISTGSETTVVVPYY